MIRDQQWAIHDVNGISCEVFTPTNPSEHSYTVLYLHDVRQESLRQQASFVDELEQRGLRAVSPQCGPCWWSNRKSRGFPSTQTDGQTAQTYLLESVMPFVEEELQAKTPRIALLGTSMGGQGALRLSYLFPDVFPIVAAIKPAIDFQLRIREGDPILTEMYGDPESGRQDTATLHIHPLNWPRNQFFCCDPEDRRWYDSADRLRMKLGSLGVPFECDLDTSIGGRRDYGFEYYNHMAHVAFEYLEKALERERLRVV